VARHIELERKYDADPGLAIPDLRDVRGFASVGAPETHTLHALYFDTEDLRLAARGISLRRRTGGGDEGWHLKLPVAKDTKEEVRAPLEASEQSVPEELAVLVAAHVRGRELVPVADVDTRRTEYGLLAGDGTVLAELADDTVNAQRLTGDEGEVSLLSWREIEVEIVDGTPELLDLVGTRLRDAGVREASAGSKLARALEGDLVPVRRPSATGTAGEVLLTYVGRHFEELLAYDPKVRVADHDDDSVHKMRVAARRIRSVLRTHRRVIGADTAPLDAELKWLTDALGEVRDLEVQHARFTKRLEKLPDASASPAWLTGMAAEEREARARLRETLLGQRYYDVLNAADAFLAAPPLNDRAGRTAKKETRKIVAKAWRKMVGRHAKAAALPVGDERDIALHQTRKAAKRARYTSEAAAAALGKPAEKLARRAARLQGVLGDQHDAVVATHLLPEIAGRPGTPGKDIFVLGRLTEVERATGEHELERLPTAAKKAAKRKPLRELRKK
jgi:CHAD domain-containing protein